MRGYHDAYASFSLESFAREVLQAPLSKPPANGRRNGLFAWDEGCGGKHARKIDADG